LSSCHEKIEEKWRRGKVGEEDDGGRGDGGHKRLCQCALTSFLALNIWTLFVDNVRESISGRQRACLHEKMFSLTVQIYHNK